jgi:KipI family sensor histidine kinase inhibitor
MRVLPVGLSALLVEVDGQDEVRALHAELTRRRAAGDLPAVGEIVPGARTILLDGLLDPRGVARELAGWSVPPIRAADGPLVEVPTVYDGEDVEEVAARWGVGVSDVAEIHTRIEFRVAFLGFAPGFAYLTGLPDRYRVPRRPPPRPRVPVGSVAIADAFSAIYPRATPGGWQLIGRTELAVWDPTNAVPSPFDLGTRVRFSRAT